MLQHCLASFAVLIASGFSLASESNSLPVGVPPVMGKAVAEATEGDDSKSEWTIALTLPRDTWREIQVAMPKLDWPEPKWEEVRPGFRDGTMTLLMGDHVKPVFCRVVDIGGKELGGKEVLEQLKHQTPVLVSASGQIPNACYLRLPTPAKLIVLLGPGNEQGVPSASVPADKAHEERDIDLNEWTAEKSQEYFRSLMQKSANFRVSTAEEASKYLQGIWRLDKRAHIRGGHHVRADRGGGITVICTDEWLVVRALSAADPGDMTVARFDRIELDESGHLRLKGKNSFSLNHFQPLDNDHMAVLAYDFLAVVRRIACPAIKTGESDGSKSATTRRLVPKKILDVNTEDKTDFKSAAINISENQDAIVVGQYSLENQYLPVDEERPEANPIALDEWQFPILIPGSTRVIAGRSNTVSLLEPLNQLKVIGTMPHAMQAGDWVLPAVSPDGKFICTRAKLDHLQFFDAKTARPITAPIRQTGRVLTMEFTSDSKYLCSCADDEPDDFDSQNPRPIPKTNTGDDGLRVWNPKTGDLVAGPFGSGISFRYPASIAAYDPIDQRVVTVENSEFDVDELSSKVAIHSVKHNKESIAIIEIPAHSYQVRWIAADRLLINGRRMESVEARRSRLVYGEHPLFLASLGDGKVTVVQLAEDCVWYPEIAPDNKYIATMVRHPEGVRTTCWRVGQIERLWKLPGMLVAFGDNGWLATQQRGGITQIRSLHDGRVIWQRENVLEAKVKGKNLWLFTAKGYEVWQVNWVDKQP